MLTENQLTKLEELINHPIYGILLKNAIEIWKNEAIPARASFGISTADDSNNKFKLRNTIKNRPCCCLIGAALIGKVHMKKYSEFISDIIYSASQEYDISVYEIDDIISGFDNSCSGEGSEAHSFGKEVAEILFYEE